MKAARSQPGGLPRIHCGDSSASAALTARSGAAKPILEWVPSQNGLLVDPPQRQSAMVERSIRYSDPSASSTVTRLLTRHGPFSVGVMVTAASVIPLVYRTPAPAHTDLWLFDGQRARHLVWVVPAVEVIRAHRVRRREVCFFAALGLGVDLGTVDREAVFDVIFVAQCDRPPGGDSEVVGEGERFDGVGELVRADRWAVRVRRVTPPTVAVRCLTSDICRRRWRRVVTWLLEPRDRRRSPRSGRRRTTPRRCGLLAPARSRPRPA